MMKKKKELLESLVLTTHKWPLIHNPVINYVWTSIVLTEERKAKRPIGFPEWSEEVRWEDSDIWASFLSLLQYMDKNDQIQKCPDEPKGCNSFAIFQQVLTKSLVTSWAPVLASL